MKVTSLLLRHYQQVLSLYREASSGPFAGHPLGKLVRQELPALLKGYSDDAERYIFKGSVGPSVWARTPWIAILDFLITRTVQSGYYPVYLFREDMTGVYLSLNQGVTSVQNKYRAKAHEALRARAADFRAQLGTESSNFNLKEIDLRPSSSSDLSPAYVTCPA